MGLGESCSNMFRSVIFKCVLIVIQSAFYQILRIVKFVNVKESANK